MKTLKTIKREIFRSGNALDGRVIDKALVKQIVANTKIALDKGITIPIRFGHSDKDEKLKGKILAVAIKAIPNSVEIEISELKKDRLKPKTKKTATNTFELGLFAEIELFDDTFDMVQSGRFPNVSIGVSPSLTFEDGSKIKIHLEHLAFIGTSIAAMQHLRNDAKDVIFKSQYMNDNGGVIHFAYKGEKKEMQISQEKFRAFHTMTAHQFGEMYGLNELIQLMELAKPLAELAKTALTNYPTENEDEEQLKQDALISNDEPQGDEGFQERDDDEEKKDEDEGFAMKKQIAALESKVNSQECKELFSTFLTAGKVAPDQEKAFASVFNAGSKILVQQVYGNAEVLAPQLDEKTGGQTKPVQGWEDADNIIDFKDFVNDGYEKHQAFSMAFKRSPNKIDIKKIDEITENII